MRPPIRVVAMAAVALTLVTAFPFSGPAAASAGPPGTLGRIAVVPLDDRPFASHTPAAVAEAGGHEAAAPPKELLGDFLTPGNSDAVGEWWQEAARSADGSVVACRCSPTEAWSPLGPATPAWRMRSAASQWWTR